MLYGNSCEFCTFYFYCEKWNQLEPSEPHLQSDFGWNKLGSPTFELSCVNSTSLFPWKDNLMMFTMCSVLLLHVGQNGILKVKKFYFVIYLCLR